jgi:hypothetical protein
MPDLRVEISDAPTHVTVDRFRNFGEEIYHAFRARYLVDLAEIDASTTHFHVRHVHRRRLRSVSAEIPAHRRSAQLLSVSGRHRMTHGVNCGTNRQESAVATLPPCGERSYHSGVSEDLPCHAIAGSLGADLFGNFGRPFGFAYAQERKRQQGRGANLAIEASGGGKWNDRLERPVELEETLTPQLQALEMGIERYALPECYNCVLQLARCHKPPTSIVPSPCVIAVTLTCNFQAVVKVGFHEAPLT